MASKKKALRVIGITHDASHVAPLEALSVCDEVICADATDALECHAAVMSITNGELADLVINCVNVPNTEMASILACRDRGTVYFFGMATSFSQAALGAEGVGKDIDMLVGNGYAHGHAEMAMQILRDAPVIRELYEKLYA